MNDLHASSSARTLGIAIAILAARGPALAQDSWFPLEPGNRWEYVDERFEGNTRAVSVKGQEGAVFTLDYFGTEVLLTGDVGAGEVDIVLPGEGPQTYYRFGEESFLHRDFQGCDDSRILSVVSHDELVMTPFGDFDGCLRIEYEPGPCADSGTQVEFWAPGIGRVKWTEGSFGGPRTFSLASFSKDVPEPRFRRGDADATGEVDVTDSVFVLNWLFRGTAEPGCLDAADANDDGQVDLSDPVYVLGFLFLGGGAPPAPGPQDCGFDLTEDELAACDGTACEVATITGG